MIQGARSEDEFCIEALVFDGPAAGHRFGGLLRFRRYAGASFMLVGIYPAPLLAGPDTQKNAAGRKGNSEA